MRGVWKNIMKLDIETFNSNTGWVSSDILKVNVYAQNQIPEYIANDYSNSLVFKWEEGGISSTIKKVLTPVNVTNYSELVFHVYSRNQKHSDLLTDSSGYSYSIRFNNSMTPVLIPCYDTFTDITIDISSITSIDYIEIKSLHDNEDYLILSHMVVVEDEIPLDIFKAVKTELETIRGMVYSDILCSKLTGSDGGKTLNFTGNKYFIEKYTCIKITDGVNTEYHQVYDNDEKGYTLTDLYDGNSLINDYSNADVYLFIPVEYGKRDNEIVLPSIVINGMVGNPIQRNSKVSDIIDNYKSDDTAKVRRDLQYYEWEIDLDIESRSDELLAICSKIVRYFIAREKLWVNGRLYRIYFKGDPVFIEANEYYNQIPKIQYKLMIEIKEDIWQRNSLVKTENLLYNYTVEVQ